MTSQFLSESIFEWRVLPLSLSFHADDRTRVRQVLSVTIAVEPLVTSDSNNCTY